MTEAASTDRDLLRHAVATLAYRAAKALRDAPPDFAGYRVGPTSRTPVEIVGHMADLIEWGKSIAEGRQRWTETTSESWEEQVSRFFDALAELDDLLASDRPLERPAGRLFQGPVADALTHVGQITMLRRLADAPVKGENYYRAKIQPGRTGPEQDAPVHELD
jgi:hypothetical protein